MAKTKKSSRQNVICIFADDLGISAPSIYNKNGKVNIYCRVDRFTILHWQSGGTGSRFFLLLLPASLNAPL